MRRIPLFSSATLALLVPLASMAAESASLQVSGNLSPPSCDVSLSGRDTVDLGPIPVGSFVPGKDNVLPETAAFLTVDCAGMPAKFRLKASDSTGATASTAGPANYGLGMNGGRPIGYFTLSIAADIMTQNGFVLKSTDGGAGNAWTVPVHGKVPFDHDGETFAFAASEMAVEPAALTALAVPLSIQPVLAKNPVVNNDVTLAGQVTLELSY